MSKFQSKSAATPSKTHTKRKDGGQRGHQLNPFTDLLLQADFRLLILLVLFFVFYVLAGEIASDWIYLIAAGTLALIILGFLLPLFEVLDTNASIDLPVIAQAEERLVLRLLVTHSIFQGAWGELFSLRWLRFKINLIKQEKLHRKGFVEPCLVIHAGKEQSATAVTESLKRGLYKFDSLQVTTCFPFAVVWWSRKLPTALMQKKLVGEPGLLTVYPRLVRMRALFLETSGAGGDTRGYLHERNRASQESAAVRGLRDYRIGDSPRWVHWPSTARANRILVKEFESESLPQYFLVLDPQAPWRSEDQFELAVCLANSIIHCQGPTRRFQLLVPPTDALKDVYALPMGLTKSKEILVRLEGEIDPTQPRDTIKKAQQASFRRVKQIFHETLRRHPGSVLLSILPGAESPVVNVLETIVDQHALPFRQHGCSQRHHALSPEMTAKHHKPLAVKENALSWDGRIIAQVSEVEEIALL